MKFNRSLQAILRNHEYFIYSTILFSFLTFYSCQNNPKTNKDPEKVVLTETQKRKYFADHIAYRGLSPDGFQGQDSVETFGYFMRNYYPELKSHETGELGMYAFEEHYIDTLNIDSTVNWFRIMVNPSFLVPYCIIVEKKIGKTYLTCKMTDGWGGYHWGTLAFSNTTLFSDSLYNNLSKELDELKFWTLDKDGYSSCCDGETWRIEAIENGKYNVIYRWAPDFSKEAAVLKLYQIGVDLRTKSKMLEIYALMRGIDKNDPFIRAF